MKERNKEIETYYKSSDEEEDELKENDNKTAEKELLLIQASEDGAPLRMDEHAALISDRLEKLKNDLMENGMSLIKLFMPHPKLLVLYVKY